MPENPIIFDSKPFVIRGDFNYKLINVAWTLLRDDDIFDIINIPSVFPSVVFHFVEVSGRIARFGEILYTLHIWVAC